MDVIINVTLNDMETKMFRGEHQIAEIVYGDETTCSPYCMFRKTCLAPEVNPCHATNRKDKMEGHWEPVK